MSTVRIAIDGPAGAGKSTMAKAVAQELRFVYIDTGAMYRAVALKAIESKNNTNDIKEISTILEDLYIQIEHVNNEQVIFLNGRDVTPDIRTSEVSAAAAAVASIPEVRLKLVDIQRKIAAQHNVVMDGRDIGTYVLPNANVKIFLTAALEDRARRRYEEMIEKGQICTFEQVKRDLLLRDEVDSSRAFAPLKAAEDAIMIDTTGLEVAQSIRLILQAIRKGLDI